MSVYDNIDRIIKEKGISRRKLARMAGIKETTLAACFARRPEHFPLKYGEAIARVLDVDVSDLYGYRAGVMSIDDILAITKSIQELPEEEQGKAFQSSIDKLAEEETRDNKTVLDYFDHWYGQGAGKDVLKFAESYGKLNAAGREAALQAVEDMTQLERYKKEPSWKKVFPPEKPE